MKKQLITLATFAFALFIYAGQASASYCPVTPGCTLTRSCKCKSGTYKGEWTHKFKTWSLNLSSQCSKGAKNARKKLEKKHKGRTYRCTWKKIRSKVKNVLGRKTGYCKFRLTCTWTTAKRSKKINRYGKAKTYTGAHYYRYKGYKKPNACKKALQKAEAHVAKRFKCKVQGRSIVTRKSWKNKNVLGYKTRYCKVWYKIKCARIIKHNCYYCTGR